MTHGPKIPKEQRSFADRGGASQEEAMTADRRDLATGAQSGQPGDADVNLETQGRFGNLRQNLTTHWKVQQR
ncbi:hypothetical protein [Brevundimonas sp. FT23042]|uniref:hypothetical protein n=1 Tax=Brevundimonas sp. FT23042 TaxID=3393749 RepID=UPI003B587525